MGTRLSLLTVYCLLSTLYCLSMSAAAGVEHRCAAGKDEGGAGDG